MISVIGLLLCFTSENLTKKRRLFHPDRVVVIIGGLCMETIRRKHISGDFVERFQQREFLTRVLVNICIHFPPTLNLSSKLYVNLVTVTCLYFFF